MKEFIVGIAALLFFVACAVIAEYYDNQQAKSNQMMRISERLGMYDRTKLKMDAPVFDDPDDFVYWRGINQQWITMVDTDLADMDAVTAWATCNCLATIPTKGMSEFAIKRLKSDFIKLNKQAI